MLALVLFVTGAVAATGRAAAQTGRTACTDEVYTPVTATQERVGTLCVPTVVTSDTLVVLVHGGGGYEGTRADLSAWQEAYADDGVPTLAIDYALTGERGETPVYPLAEQNVKAAVEYARLREAAIGTTRVVIQGHSAGARLGAIVLTTPDDPFYAGPELRDDVSDAVDGFIGFYGYYGDGQFQADAYYGAAPREPADAVTNAGRASGPALLVHGIDDGLVPARRSVRFADALGAEGRSVRLELMADAGHGFDGYGQPTLTAQGRRSAELVLEWLAVI